MWFAPLTLPQVAALTGYEHANSTALGLWEALYPDAMLLALTDTFSTKVFFMVHTSIRYSSDIHCCFQEFVKNPTRAQRWKGLRQDSGDPFTFAPWAKAVYESMGIDHKEKMIIFSDALNLGKALALKKQCDTLGFNSMSQNMSTCTYHLSTIAASFGIGTFLTNDFNITSKREATKSKALNMVIKITSVDGKPCVKISDDIDKACHSIMPLHI
jgi:nicotinate phosphoribosyltransferase